MKPSFLERSFMHLGFHIFDVGFQPRNSEAGKPMVFVTTLLLLALIVLMNSALQPLAHARELQFLRKRRLCPIPIRSLIAA